MTEGVTGSDSNGSADTPGGGEAIGSSTFDWGDGAYQTSDGTLSASLDGPSDPTSGDSYDQLEILASHSHSDDFDIPGSFPNAPIQVRSGDFGAQTRSFAFSSPNPNFTDPAPPLTFAVNDDTLGGPANPNVTILNVDFTLAETIDGTQDFGATATLTIATPYFAVDYDDNVDPGGLQITDGAGGLIYQNNNINPASANNNATVLFSVPVGPALAIAYYSNLNTFLDGNYGYGDHQQNTAFDWSVSMYTSDPAPSPQAVRPPTMPDATTNQAVVPLTTQVSTSEDSTGFTPGVEAQVDLSNVAPILPPQSDGELLESSRL